MTANGPMFTAAVTHSVTLTAGTVSGISTIIGGAGLIDNISTMMNMMGPENALGAAMNGGMRTLRGPSAPDEMVDVLEKLGRPMSRNKIREVIHEVKRKMNIGADEDLVFDYSGGLWDSRTGEYIGKIWEAF